MKKLGLILLCSGVSFFGLSQSKKVVIAQNDSLKTATAALQQEVEQLKAKIEVDLTDEKSKFSYAIGLSFANNLKTQGIDSVESAAVAKAMEDLTAGKPAIEMAEANQIIQSYMEDAAKRQYSVNIEEGEKFLAENGKREGVVTLPSGMQYEIITEGKGEKPAATDKVTTHYHGTLISGKVFDSSVERNQPASFPVNGVIQGWQEALQLMPVGSKWKLYIPYTLAYGERGAGADIQPYSTLVFEVELISIDK